MKNEELTSREIRRRRRIRNQILAYVVLICLIALSATGVVLGVRATKKGLDAYNEKVDDAMAEAENQVMTETQGDSEETLTQEEPTEEAPPEPDPLDELVDALLQEMTLEEKVAGMFIVSPESITGVGKVVQAGEGTKKALEQYPVGGILYAEKNFKSEEQFLEMMTNTRTYSRFPLFLAVQRECGSSESFGVPETAKAAELTKTQEVQAAYTTIAEKLATYGMNMNIAPVADVVSEEGNQSLQGRTFGSDAATAAPLVSAAVTALQEKEISAVLTKFPGEGSINTSQGMTITKTPEELKNSEFLTYQMAIQNGVDCILVSNASAPEVVGDETPCSMSGVIIQDILRKELGFQGVVMTDMLNDKTITAKYSAGESAVTAILAGADILFVPEDYPKAYEGVMQAIADGTITEDRIQESLVRIYRLKYKHALDNAE